jgi:hypothetical protein
MRLEIGWMLLGDGFIWVVALAQQIIEHLAQAAEFQKALTCR